jgi:DNA-binding MarR family transcriptional regulator
MVSVRSEQFTVDDEIGLDGRIDRPRVGIDPDMAWLLTPTPPSDGDDLTSLQELAAALLAEMEQPERVDAVLDLDQGTVRRWSAESETFRRAALRRRRAMKPQVDRPHYEAALSPIQRQAALMQAEGKSKTKIADALEIHRSTIHNWEKDPAYRGFVRRLVDDFTADRRAEINHLRAAQLVLANRAIERGLGADDVQAAAKLGVSVVKLYEF